MTQVLQEKRFVSQDFSTVLVSARRCLDPQEGPFTRFVQLDIDPASESRRWRLSPQAARELAEALIDSADAADGAPSLGEVVKAASRLNGLAFDFAQSDAAMSVTPGEYRRAIRNVRAVTWCAINDLGAAKRSAVRRKKEPGAAA